MSQPPVHYRLISEVKIRRESFGGILYKYGCADRGALSFVNSPQLIELLIAGQQQHEGNVSAAIENHHYSEASKQKLYLALDDLVGRGFVQNVAVQGDRKGTPLPRRRITAASSW